jgi:hypothetical protein
MPLKPTSADVRILKEDSRERREEHLSITTHSPWRDCQMPAAAAASSAPTGTRQLLASLDSASMSHIQRVPRPALLP